MKNFFMYIGAVLVNLILALGLLSLPPLGTTSLENIFVLVWLTFGLLINLGFLRQVFKHKPRTHKKQAGSEQTPRVRPGALP